MQQYTARPTIKQPSQAKSRHKHIQHLVHQLALCPQRSGKSPFRLNMTAFSHIVGDPVVSVLHSTQQQRTTLGILALCTMTDLDHFLHIVGDMLEQARSHVRWAVHDEAKGHGGPPAQPSHECACIRCVSCHSKGCHELEGTLHAGFHPLHVCKVGVAPEGAGEHGVCCHDSYVHLTCTAHIT